jgi:RNA polymerase sigma-70 factor (ECF subfamily)
MTTQADRESGDLAPNDLETVAKARKGDPAAFHELVDRHAAYLFGLAASLVGNATDAEDIVQETFAGAFRGLAAFRGRSSLKTWLTQILLRQAAAHRRGRRRFLSFLAVRSSSVPEHAPSASPSSDARMDVAAALKALSEEHRQVVVLREFQGLSYEEIAEVLSLPQGTVESRLFRARRALQELLRGYLA